MRKRLFISSEFPEIRDAAAPDAPGCWIDSDGKVSATSLVELLNRLLPPPVGPLYCGGSGSVNRSGVKGPAPCPACGQVLQPPDDQEGRWRPWAYPKHNQPDES